MYVCMYVCMHVCMYVFMNECTYVLDAGVKIQTSTGCRDIVHEVDENGRPTRVKGIKVSVLLCC